jgi:hypothetical protein
VQCQVNSDFFLGQPNALAGAMRAYNRQPSPLQIEALKADMAHLCDNQAGHALESILPFSADLSGLRALYKCR